MSNATSSSANVLQAGQADSTGPMRPFGRPRTTGMGAAATESFSFYQPAAAGGDGSGRDEIDVLFDAVPIFNRSVALPSMLQEAKIVETYIRALPREAYLRI